MNTINIAPLPPGAPPAPPPAHLAPTAGNYFVINYPPLTPLSTNPK